jgi:hypothetical protein
VTAVTRPSAITFTCPPWCKQTTAGHFEDFGNYEGRIFHWSRDRKG